MISKMTTNSQQATTEPKKQKQTKQTTRKGTDSVGRRRGEDGRKATRNKKYKW